MHKITLKELREVKEILLKLLPPDKKDWKECYLTLTEDIDYVIKQLERFQEERKFEFKSGKFMGACIYIYSTVLRIDRGEYPHLSLEERNKIRRTDAFLNNLWNAIIEKMWDDLEKKRRQ